MEEEEGVAEPALVLGVIVEAVFESAISRVISMLIIKQLLLLVMTSL